LITAPHAVSVLARLGVSLAADHRARDGHRGSVFLDVMERLLQTPARL
jgi:pyruvate/2-oxoglutarate dehydrogenase complex dihydrolipoamide acyltransferase (E2) component